MVEAPRATGPGTAPPQGLPADFAAPQYKGAERALGELLRALVQSSLIGPASASGRAAGVRTHGEMKRQATARSRPTSSRSCSCRSCRSEIAANGRNGGLGFRLRKSPAGPLPGERGARPQRPDRRIPRDPAKVVSVEAARHLEGSAAALLPTRRPCWSPDRRLGEIHHAVLADRSDQPHAHRPHIITIEDPIEFVHENKNASSRSGRWVCTPTASSGGCDRHCGRTRISCWWARCAISKPLRIAMRDGRGPVTRVSVPCNTTTAASTVDSMIDNFQRTGSRRYRVMLPSRSRA